MFYTASGSWVRYHMEKGRVIRNVLTDDGIWKGTMILLPAVEEIKFKKKPNGVSVEVLLTQVDAQYQGEFMIRVEPDG